MKLAVIGTKEFRDYEFLKKILEKVRNIEQIVSGGAKGTDTLARQYARENKIDFREFPPKHQRCGEEAKHIRDKKIVENCDKIIAFYDGKCEGTAYTLAYGRQLNREIRIIRI